MYSCKFTSYFAIQWSKLGYKNNNGKQQKQNNRYPKSGKE